MNEVVPKARNWMLAKNLVPGDVIRCPLWRRKVLVVSIGKYANMMLMGVNGRLYPCVCADSEEVVVFHRADER